MKDFDRIPRPPTYKKAQVIPKKPDVAKFIKECRLWIKHCNGTITNKDLEEDHE